MDDNGLNSPATKGDLQDLAQQLRSEFRSDLQQLRSEFRSDLQQLRDDLKEAIRDSQTEVLKGFYGYIESLQIKLKDTESREDFLRQRINVLESRVLEVERRLNMPPRP